MSNAGAERRASVICLLAAVFFWVSVPLCTDFRDSCLMDDQVSGSRATEFVLTAFVFCDKRMNNSGEDIECYN